MVFRSLIRRGVSSIGISSGLTEVVGELTASVRA